MEQKDKIIPDRLNNGPKACLSKYWNTFMKTPHPSECPFIASPTQAFPLELPNQQYVLQSPN